MKNSRTGGATKTCFCASLGGLKRLNTKIHRCPQHNPVQECYVVTHQTHLHDLGLQNSIQEKTDFCQLLCGDPLCDACGPLVVVQELHEAWQDKRSFDTIHWTKEKHCDAHERRWWSSSVCSHQRWRTEAARRDPAPQGCPGSQILPCPGQVSHKTHRKFRKMSSKKWWRKETCFSLEWRLCSLSQASSDSHPTSRAHWKGWTAPGLQLVGYWQSRAQ